MRKTAWSTRYGYYLVIVASAFSLGNLWRFPFVVEANDGASFVIPYIFSALILGLPLVITEIILGKAYKQSVIGALDQLTRESMLAPRLLKRTHLWVWIGRFANYASVLLLAYYAVICGWVLYFLGMYAASVFGVTETEGPELLNNLATQGYTQVGLTFVHILITAVAVSKGLREGIEKSLGWLMPLFFALIIFLVIRSLMLPSASDAIRYLFYPNFSDISSGTLTQVIGHVCFTLSIGMGTIAVFGSSLREDSRVTPVSFWMVVLDTAMSLCVGLLIFPLVFTLKTHATGPSLMFDALPRLFDQVQCESFGCGKLIGVAFLLCLYIAALASSIGLLEASVSNLVDRHKFTRPRAARRMGFIAFGIAILPALSSSVLKDIKILKMPILTFFDTFVVNWILPLVALGIALAVGYGMKTEQKKNLFIDPNQPETIALFGDWQFLIRWVVPLFILFAVIVNVWGVFKN